MIFKKYKKNNNNKSGGVRPIVVGFTLRHLVSKCAHAAGVARLTSYFCTVITLPVGVCISRLRGSQPFSQKQTLLGVYAGEMACINKTWSLLSRTCCLSYTPIVFLAYSHPSIHPLPRILYPDVKWRFADCSRVTYFESSSLRTADLLALSAKRTVQVDLRVISKRMEVHMTVLNHVSKIRHV